MVKGNKQKLEVDVFGVGTDKVSVESATTIGELRSIMNVDADIKAIDERGQKLRDTDTVGNRRRVNFVPNVEGGC